MKKKLVIILLILAILAIIGGILLIFLNKEISSKFEIIDATYACADTIEKFYEDDNYEYYFPCQKSATVFVKFKNGNKMLVTQALEEERVTIDELIKAGLEVHKEEK